MQLKDIEKLAHLARIELSESEKISFSESLESILGYVGQIQSLVVTDTLTDTYAPINVMREDNSPNQSGQYTTVLLDAAPDTKDNFVKVKQIL